MRTKVYGWRKRRGGWVCEADVVTVAPGPTPDASDPDGVAVLIEFEMRSARGGKVQVAVNVPPVDFYPLLEAMLVLDPKRFGDALGRARPVARRRRAAEAARSAAAEGDGGRDGAGGFDGGGE